MQLTLILLTLVKKPFEIINVYLCILRGLMDRMGSRALQEILNKQLGRHINEKLPAIKTNLKSTLGEIENELREMGYYDQEEEKSKTKLFKT